MKNKFNIFIASCVVTAMLLLVGGAYSPLQPNSVTTSTPAQLPTTLQGILGSFITNAAAYQARLATNGGNWISISFNQVTDGTLFSQDLLVGTDSSLRATGSGTIAATTSARATNDALGIQLPNIWSAQHGTANGTNWAQIPTNVLSGVGGGNPNAITNNNVGPVNLASNLTAVAVIDKYNVKYYGATADGTTDDTASFAAAIAAVAGKSIAVPSGTYILDNLAVSKDATFKLDAGATLKHKAASAGDLISFTATNLTIEGGAIDGNLAAQTGRPYLINGSVQSGKAIKLHNIAIKNSVKAVLYVPNFGGLIEMEHCTLTGQAESTDGSDETYIMYVVSGEVNAKGLLRFNHNICTATVPAANAGGSPGGVFFCSRTNAIADPPAGNFSTLEAIGNKFYGYGQNIGISDISPIHFYPASGGARIIGNYFEQCGFCAISAKSVQDIVIADNVILYGQTTTKNVASEGAISYVPGYQAEANVRPRAVISGNIVDTPGGETGVGKQACISVHGNTSYATGWVIANNVLNNGGYGLHLDYVTDGTIIGNEIIGGTGGTAGTEHGIAAYHANGHIRILDNHITTANGHGIIAETSLNTSTFDVIGNRFDHSAAACYACTIRGALRANYSANVFNATAGVGCSFNQDVDGKGNPWIHWDAGNTFEAGGLSINWNYVTNISGAWSYEGTPYNIVTPGEVGTLYRQTDGAAGSTLWIAEGTTKTSWRTALSSGWGYGYAGLVASGAATNAAGSRVAYLSDVGAADPWLTQFGTANGTNWAQLTTNTFLNYPLLAGVNTLTGTNTFSGPVNFNGTNTFGGSNYFASATIDLVEASTNSYVNAANARSNAVIALNDETNAVVSTTLFQPTNAAAAGKTLQATSATSAKWDDAPAPTVAQVTNVLPAIVTNAVNTTGKLQSAVAVESPSYRSAASSLDYATVWDCSKNTTLATNANFTISGFSNFDTYAATNWQYSGLTITNNAASGSITVTLPNGTITPDGSLTQYVTNGTKRVFSLLNDGTTNVCTTTFYKGS